MDAFYITLGIILGRTRRKQIEDLGQRVASFDTDSLCTVAIPPPNPLLSVSVLNLNLVRYVRLSVTVPVVSLIHGPRLLTRQVQVVRCFRAHSGHWHCAEKTGQGNWKNTFSVREITEILIWKCCQIKTLKHACLSVP